MKKITALATLTLSGFLISGCSSMRPKMKKPSQQMTSLMESVQLKSEDVFEKAPKSGEYTHEMAEADADDQKIKQEVGDAEIDKELPGSEEDKIPYARNFLALKNTKRMQFWVDYFTVKNRDRFQRFINNGEEYRHIIENIFQEHGLPKELYFVGLIESGYYLGARSHASAVGPWQFIRGTGKRYGLKITPEIDERQDLFKATKTAALYFKDLHNVFSSWELALSAYNAGEYGIIRRIMKHGTRDFYELSRNKQLPSETINYVPKVLAAMHVVNNAEKYGFVLPRKKVRLFDLTELRPVKKNVSLNIIAGRLGVDVAILRKLNPELKRNSTPARVAGTYYLRIPQSKYSYKLESVVDKTAFEKPESLKDLNRRTAEASSEQRGQPRIRAKYHRIKRGETLFSVARKYDLSPRELALWNRMTVKTKVKLGARLALSQIEDEQRTATRSLPKVRVTNRPIVYKIRRGDNLAELARLFDIKVSRIKKANNLQRGQVLVGQKIVLPNTRKGIYTVRKGDHIQKVARELKVPVEEILKLNSLKRGAIYPGQKIIVNMD